jgi:hypothetical protein
MADRKAYYRANRDKIIAQNKVTYKKHRLQRIAGVMKRYAAQMLLIKQLKDKPCKDCGVQYPPYVMDFDHVRGEKVKNVSSMRSQSLEAIVLEADKCDVVCANCHRARTYGRLEHTFYDNPEYQ